MPTRFTDWLLDNQCFTDLNQGIPYLRINQVKLYLQTHPQESIPASVPWLTEMVGGVEMVRGAAASWNRGPAKPEDPNVPVILYQLDNGALVLVDGYHRLDRAVREGVEQIPAVIVRASDVPCDRGRTS